MGGRCRCERAQLRFAEGLIPVRPFLVTVTAPVSRVGLRGALRVAELIRDAKFGSGSVAKVCLSSKFGLQRAQHACSRAFNEMPAQTTRSGTSERLLWLRLWRSTAESRN